MGAGRGRRPNGSAHRGSARRTGRTPMSLAFALLGGQVMAPVIYDRSSR